MKEPKDPIIEEVRRVRATLGKFRREHPEEFLARLQKTRERFKDYFVWVAPGFGATP